MLLSLTAVFLNILEKPVSTAQTEDAIRMLREACFNICLFKERVKNDESLFLVVSKLIKNHMIELS